MQQMNFRSCPGQPSGKRLRRSLGGMITMTRAPALRLLMLTAGGALLALTVARLLLLAWFSDRWQLVQLGELLTLGLRVDLIVVGAMLAVPVLLWPLLTGMHSATLWWWASRAWIGGLLLAIVLLEVSTPSFLKQYEARPNHLAVEYLRDWDSILPMLWNGFRTPLLASGLALLVGAGLLPRWLRHRPAQLRLPPVALLLWPLLLAAAVLMIRGSFDHRPANPALFARWPDQMLNQLALNSAYSFGYAVYAQRHERSAAEVYGNLDDTALRDILREDRRFAAGAAERPTWHRQVPQHARARPLNLIVVVEESLGADFSARLDGRGLTPELDRWSTRGIWFEQLYATGTRSARGLEAIVAGFPPSPAPAVLKRERAQDGLATLASVLADLGYRSRFIYGGAAHFDNMRGFFLGNGFDAVIERRDFAQPRHVGSWGVSDEDLFERALLETDAAVARGERFFHLVFSSSHHEPFDFPAGRMPPDSGVPGTADGAVRYADFALGGFLDAAAQRKWFADTLVLVVADHDVRVYGDAVIPLRRFQIPGLIVGADIVPTVVRSLASQIDLAPTLLSLMGVEAEVPFPGRDLAASLPEFGIADGPQPRALMQFDDRFAWLTAGELRVLHPGGRAERWLRDAGGDLVSAQALSEVQQRNLLAQALLGDWLYRHRAYATATPSRGSHHLALQP
jgi:phosphoglycerol transferase MdoB-like AlkP superfamily enzyme